MPVDRTPAKRKAKRVEPKKDTKAGSEFRKAEAQKQTPVYRKAVREAYDSKTPEQKRARLKVTVQSPEGKVVAKVHKDRSARLSEILKSQATKDTKGTVELRRGRKVSEAEIKKVRQRYLKKNEQRAGLDAIPGAILGQAKKELEGRGVLAAAGKGLADNLAFAHDPITNDKGLGKYVERGAKDLANLPAQVPTAVYVPGKALVHKAKGDDKDWKQLKKDVTENDAVYNLGAAAVEKLKGNSKAAKSHLKKAQKSADEHPGFAAVELFGLKGAVGTGAGRVARTGVAGKKVQKAASTRREPRRVEGTEIVEQRAYSRDVITKGRQVAVEKAKRRKARRLREEADRVEPVSQRRADELRLKAARKDPDRVPMGEIEKRVDERFAANEEIRRGNRREVSGAVQQLLKGAKRERNAVSLVAQNITKASKDDLRAYVAELRDQYPSLTGAEKRANRTLRQKVQKVIDDPKANMGNLEVAARKYAEMTRPLEKKLTDSGLLDPVRAERASLIPYAVRNMGAKHDGKKMVDAKGRALQESAILAHMKENKVSKPAFITQAPNQRGGRNFNIRSERVQGISNQRRTGEATRKGTFDSHPETLVENAARQQGLVDATDGFRGFIKEVAVRGSQGKVKTVTTKKQADDAIREMHAKDPSREWAAIRVNPFGGKQAQLKALLDDVDADAQMAGTTKERSALVQALEDALDGKGEGDFAIIPKEAANRLQAHLRAMGQGPTGKLGQKLNSMFRQTVLGTSPSWFTGNIAEASMRSAVARAGPRSYMTGRRVMKRLEEKDPKAALELRARATGGGHYSFASRAHVNRGAEQFADSPKLAPVANALGKFWATPGPKQAAGAWHAWTDIVFNVVNGRIESNFQTAMAGKHIRDNGLMDGQMVKLSKTAIDQAAEGLRNTNAQVELGRAVDRMYGRYSKFSPEKKMAVAYYTPFIAWTLNAYRFMLDVLPNDHPVLTGLIASMENATDEWRKEEGLDLFIEGRVPGWLQGSIPLKDGGHVRAGKYTPAGAFGDPLGTWASAVLPQASGVLAAFKGEDWKGKELRDENGQPLDVGGQAKAAAVSLVNSSVPIIALAGRIEKKGLEALNPFAVVKPAEKKRKGRKTTKMKWSGDSGSVKWGDQAGGVKWGN